MAKFPVNRLMPRKRGSNGSLRPSYIHPSAEVDKSATVGICTKIWAQAQICKGAVIGNKCIIGKGAYIGNDVRVGDKCKIQNYACLFSGTVLEDGVFIGPGCVVTNDKHPSAITGSGELKAADDWDETPH